MPSLFCLVAGQGLVQSASIKAPWKGYASFSVVAPLDEPAPKPESVLEVERWAESPGVRPVAGDRYRLIVGRDRKGTLVSNRIPEVRRLLLLRDALRAMPKCPPGLGGSFADYGPALAAEAGASAYDVLPFHAPADGRLPPSTRFRLTPKRKITVQNGGKTFEVEVADDASSKMEPEERTRFNAWLQEGRLSLRAHGDDLARAVQSDADRYGKVNARDGVRTMILQKPYELAVAEAVFEATKDYVEYLKTLRKEAEADWAPLKSDLERRFPELGGYAAGKGWKDLSPHEQDTLRVALRSYESQGLIPGGLDAFLSGLTIGSSRLTFGLGIPFEGTRGTYHVPLSP